MNNIHVVAKLKIDGSHDFSFAQAHIDPTDAESEADPLQRGAELNVGEKFVVMTYSAAKE